MNENVSPSELALLVVNASLTRPDGAILDLSGPITDGTNFIYTAQVISFGDNDVGVYTCNATIRPHLPSTYLTGTGGLFGTIQVMIGKK